jgi:hypothetical protein
VIYDWAFKDEDKPFLSALKLFKDKISNALAGRKEAIVAAAEIMEEHPRITEVTVELEDEDVSFLRRLEKKTAIPKDYICLKVRRVKIPVFEDPSNIELELTLVRSHDRDEMSIGQVVIDLPSPFVCGTWNGETVRSTYQ